MDVIILRILTAAYVATGILNIIAYWPTIKDLYFYKKSSANTKSYALWTLTSGTSFLYCISALNDIYVQAVSGMIFLACLTVLILCLKLKYGVASALKADLSDRKAQSVRVKV